MFGDIIQPTHLLFVLVIALLVLGPKRLPEVGRSLGRGLRDFRQGIQGVQDDARGMFQEAMDEPTPPVVATVEPAAPVREPVTTMVAPTSAPPAPRAALEPDPGDYAD